MMLTEGSTITDAEGEEWIIDFADEYLDDDPESDTEGEYFPMIHLRPKGR